MKISFCVFIIFSTLSFSAAQSSSPVLDIAGNIITYVDDFVFDILSVTTGGRGITLRPRIQSVNQKCLMDVVQESIEGRNGLPLTFMPANTSQDGIVRESTDLNFILPRVRICGQPPVWKLEFVNGKWSVSSGGTIGNPGRDTVSNWFKIEKYGSNGYKIVYCPTVCNNCKPVCGNIGVSKDGRRNLILSNEPLVVMFKKA